MNSRQFKGDKSVKFRMTLFPNFTNIAAHTANYFNAQILGINFWSIFYMNVMYIVATKGQKIK